MGECMFRVNQISSSKTAIHRYPVFLTVVAALGCALLLGGCDFLQSKDDSLAADTGNQTQSTDEVSSSDAETEDLTQMTSPSELNTCPVDEITADGFYILNTNTRQAESLWWEADRTAFDELEGKYGDRDGDYDGDPTTEPDGGFLCGAGGDPFVIDVSNGDELIYVSKYDDTPSPLFYPASLLGYGNPSSEEDFEKAAEIDGVDVESCKSLESLNQQLASSNLHFYEYVREYSYYYRMLLGTEQYQEVRYGIYRGTSYEEASTEMYCPYYLALKEGKYDLKDSYEKTKDGYFVVDLDEVPEGTYFLYIMNVGDYLVQIVR